MEQITEYHLSWDHMINGVESKGRAMHLDTDKAYKLKRELEAKGITVTMIVRCRHGKGESK